MFLSRSLPFRVLVGIWSICGGSCVVADDFFWILDNLVWPMFLSLDGDFAVGVVLLLIVVLSVSSIKRLTDW